MPPHQSHTVDKRILDIARKVTGKRPRTVIDHILEHGYITNEDLKDLYGYNHPPRAIRDVREQGIPLELFKVEDKTGRKIGAYRFGDPSKVTGHKLGGRKTFSKQFKQSLLEQYSSRCALCYEEYSDRYLTIDHRVPYEVSGDTSADERSPNEFMLVCGTCQRKKSWSCEHCKNWSDKKEATVCKTCFWASPEKYSHLALRKMRRVELTWEGDDVQKFEKLEEEAARYEVSIGELIKRKLTS